MANRARALAVPLVVVLAAGLLAACGNDDGDQPADQTGKPALELYNTETLELTLVSNLERDAGSGPKVERVDCSIEGQPARGKLITCQAHGDEGGLSGPVEVTFADESGAAYSYKAELTGQGGLKQSLKGTVSGK